MKPSAYASYKPSGVAWLGDVPEHWALRSLRYAATIQNGSDFKEYEVEEGGFPVLGSGGEFARISKFIYDRPSVLLGRKGTIDNPLYIEEPFWTVDTLFYTKIANDTHPKFFYWFCTSIPFGYFQYGSAVPSMTQNDLYGIKVPTPALEEQQTIADFLDAQTAKIDTLLAKKRQFIDKLKEKRSALIARTVTRGLPPDAAQAAGLEPNPAMKDTGVEWLGEIPESWSEKRLKYVSSINDEALPETTDPEYELLYVDIGSVDATEGIQKKEMMIFENAPSRARRIVRDGDTIVSTVRTYLRAVAPIKQPEENLIVSTGFAVVRPRGVVPKFLAYCLRSSYFIETVVSRSVGVSYPATNPTDVSCIEVPLPSLAEQQAIATYLDRETARIDQLAAKVEAAIARLAEYRQALITAAVTGKIDVSQYNTQKGAQHATVTLS